MVSIFAAFDCIQKKNNTQPSCRYSKIPSVWSFEADEFTVNVYGQRWDYVPLDEVHKMCINKDLKGAIVQPTPAYLQKSYCCTTNALKPISTEKSNANEDKAMNACCCCSSKNNKPESRYQAALKATLLPQVVITDAMFIVNY